MPSPKKTFHVTVTNASSFTVEASHQENKMGSWIPQYAPWKDGWYVINVRYPSGAVGCVSNHYEDKKWRIACDPRPSQEQPTFRTRDAAARAEKQYVEEHWEALKQSDEAQRAQIANLFSTIPAARLTMPQTLDLP